MEKYMKTLKNTTLSFGLVFAFLSVGYSQDVINVTPQVLPPYDGNFTNFQNKVLVTVQNTTPTSQTITLDCAITGSNGISIESRPNPVPQFALRGNQVMQITGGQLLVFFQEQHVAVQGISKQELYSGAGLPSGNYQLCMRARNAATGGLLSMSPPSGCFPFTIQNNSGDNSVSLITQVIPPFSTYLDDYINQNKLFINLRSTVARTQSVRLAGSIKGNNGVTISIPDSYIPAVPILLGSQQVVQLSGNQLREYFNESVLVVDGISREEIFNGNGLPEGTYEWCFRALEYKTGEPISPGSPLGCAISEIRQFEPPVIIQPQCNMKVEATAFQNMLFSWTVPAGTRPDQVEYVLKIIELYPKGTDPNQMMQSANVPPFFEKVIQSNSYLYSLADPKLQKGMTYAFRVTAQTNLASRRGRRDGPLNFRNNGHSPVCTFTFGNDSKLPSHEITHVVQQGGTAEPIYVPIGDLKADPVQQASMTPDPDDVPGCVSVCILPAPTNTTPKPISPGDVIKVGRFTMTVSTGNSSAGTGTIVVNFLNTPINVQWSNIQVNTENEMFGAASKITAVMDMGELASQPVVIGGLWNAQDVPAQSVSNEVEQTSRRISTFPANNTQPTGLPLALDYGNFDLIILGIIFTPTEANMNAVSAVELMNSTASNDFLVLTSTTCIRPNGLGNIGQLALGQNKTIPLSTNVSMLLTNTTHASFDCQGIGSVELDGSLQFDRSLIVPVGNDGTVIGGATKVSAAFHTTVNDLHNWTYSFGALSHAFTIPQLIGFKFAASNIIFDHSLSSTPPAMNNVFPPGYAGTGGSWTGLFIQDLSVTLPSALKNGNSLIAFSVNNVMLDKNGFSGDIDPQVNVLPSGTIGGWNFSITDMMLEIEASSLMGSGMEGTLELPISNDNLSYEVVFETSTSESDEVEFNFLMTTNQDIEVDMWYASLDLDENSTITIDKVGPTYRPQAILSGYLTIDWSTGETPNGTNAVSQFQLPHLRIEDFTITGGTSPSITLGGVGLDNFDNDQATLVRFPLVLNSVNLNGLNTSDIQLQLGLELSLNASGNGISGETLFTLHGDFAGGHYNYDHTNLNSIDIDVDLGVAHVTGGITIYTNNTTFGDGFRGEIMAHINAINLGFAATMQVGKTNGANGFRYWYFDLRGNFGPTGFPIPGTAAAIYGMGGGAYHNMTRDVMDVVLYDDFINSPPYDATPGATVYGTPFTPSQGHFGFNASIAFGLAGTPSAFNGDLKFSMELGENGSVNSVLFQGGGYVMKALGDRSNAYISGSVMILIVPHDDALPNTPVFHLETIDADTGEPTPFSMNVATVLNGAIPLAMHFDPQTWYVKLGEWENYDEPWNDNKRMTMGVDLKVYETDWYGYFMMGNSIPGIPPMPAVIRSAFGMGTGVSQHSDVLGESNAGGIAFGAGYTLQTEPRIKFLIFYADILFTTGFDVTLKHYANNQCGDGFGIDGWYAKGQMYAYLEGEVGIEVDVWFIEGELELLSVGAGATLQAQLPNPIWLKGQFFMNAQILNGLIKVNTSFKFELGEKCLPSSGNPFDDMPIVSDVKPEQYEDNVSVFVNPDVAFNFPNEDFTVEEIKGDGSTELHTYYYTFQSFKLKYKDEDNNNKTLDITNWKKYRQDGYSAAFVSPQALPAETVFSYEIITRGWEKVPGPDKLLITEKKEGTFTTGKFPDHIAYNHIVEGWPDYRQRFFLKNDHQGQIRLSDEYYQHWDPAFWYEDVWELGNYVNANITGSFQWKAKFTEIVTGNVYYSNSNLSANGQVITFNIPNALKNNTMYNLDLVVIFHPAISAFASAPVASNTIEEYKNVLISGSTGVIANLGNSNAAFVPAQAQVLPTQAQVVPGQAQMLPSQNQAIAPSGQQILSNNVQMVAAVDPDAINSVQMFNGGNAVYEASLNMGYGGTGSPGNGTYIQRMNRQLKESTSSGKEIEQKQFKFIFTFKTSKYNTMTTKLNNTQVLNQTTNEIVVNNYHTSYPDVEVSTDVPLVLLDIKENFQDFEVFGKNWGADVDGGFVEPRIKINYDYSVDYWLEDFMDDLYEMPDDEEWEQMVMKDEFGIPIEWTVDRPTPNWSQYVIPYDDWAHNRHMVKWYPFGKRQFPTGFEMMNAIYGDALFTFYKGSTYHGSLSTTENVVIPKGRLTDQEIINVMNQAPTPPSGNLDQLIISPIVNFPTASSTYSVETLPERLAIIDYMEWLTMRDYRLFKKHIRERNLDILGSPGDANYNNYYDFYFLPIEYYLDHEMYYKHRPGPNYYRFKIENVEYEYHTPELNEDGFTENN